MARKPSGTLLDRILDELENTKMNRRGVPEGLIAEMQSRQLVTPTEAKNLNSLLEMILTAHVIDAALVKKIGELAERFHDPDSVAGTIAKNTTLVARAIHAAHLLPRE